ncbi:MAG: (2Fe-2S)-binding protein [Anaerolineaceae bacterium]|nr:(2Fe-2S)-binding protein [Anaerolineaceae bacterium]
MRITKSSSKQSILERGRPVEIMINQNKVTAFEGELVSTVLHEEGITTFNRKHKTANSSGIYCGMGICYECLVTINGVPNVRACQTPVENMMVIETGDGKKS